MVFMMPTIVRAQVAHTPRNPFVSEDALETFPDGALAFEDGRIVAVGVFDSVIGALGLELMEWLRSVALPEEARLEDSGYAASVADQFVRGLARNGTTTALVFCSTRSSHSVCRRVVLRVKPRR